MRRQTRAMHLSFHSEPRARQQELAALGPALIALRDKWQRSQIHSATLAAEYLLLFAKHRFGSQWRASRHRLGDGGSFEPWRSLAEFRIRGLGDEAREVLWLWFHGRLKMDLVLHIPTPLDILTAQSQGGRLITALFPPFENGPLARGELIEDRFDAVGFLIHDLMHAARFFFDDEWRTPQIHLYQHLLRVQASREDLWQGDREFAECLHYAMSDMNTHPAHTVSFLLASRREYFKRCWPQLKPEFLDQELVKWARAFVSEDLAQELTMGLGVSELTNRKLIAFLEQNSEG